MKAKNVLLLSLACFPLGEIWGQAFIALVNPSFEAGEAARSIVPPGWINLSDNDDSPPDIQPGGWGVSLRAQDGHKYLGLVVRDNNTWEGVGQRLDGLLYAGSSYKFSLWLSRSNTLMSPSMSGTSSTRENVNFNAPTILKIWGYNTKSKLEELLAESEPVGHSKWVRYEFILTPTLDDYDELDLMAYYASGHVKENGNLLIDNCSAIELIEK
ncbi:MAG: hypothetical protein H7246_07960 [Phycisphaerae bacterium]|nr:hypothetical protein [Saprospiraceae bacterium]